MSRRKPSLRLEDDRRRREHELRIVAVKLAEDLVEWTDAQGRLHTTQLDHSGCVSPRGERP